MVGAIVLGIVAGYIGRLLMPGRDKMGFIATMLVGLAGSVVGFLIFTELFGIGDDKAFDLGGLLGAIVGVMIAPRALPTGAQGQGAPARTLMGRDGELTSPAALPRASWPDTLKRTLRGFKDDKLNHWGAALTYYAVLSIFPALLVLVSLVGLFGSPERITKVLTDTVSELGPSTAASTFQGPIESITGNRGGAGIMFVVSVLGALWAASGYVSAFADASNSIYEVEEGRPIWKLKPLQLLVTFVLVLIAAMVALALVLSGPIVGALGGALGISDSVLGVWRYRSGRRWSCSCS